MSSTEFATKRDQIDSLIPRLIGVLIAIYGVLAIAAAFRDLAGGPGEVVVLTSISHSLDYLDFAFGVALIILGIGIATRAAWTRGVDWFSCIVIALLIPAGFDALWRFVERSRWGSSIPVLLVAALQVAGFLAAAFLLYRNFPWRPETAPGRRIVRPRVTFLSRLLGVLLVLSGLTRLWLSAVFGPEVIDKLLKAIQFDYRPSLYIGLVAVVLWSVGLALGTIVAGFGIGLRRRWGLGLGLPLGIGGVLIDLQAAFRFPVRLGPEYLDFAILRYASAILYVLVALYCLIQLLRPPKTVPVSVTPLHYPPDTKPMVADDANWRQNLLTSLRATGAQPVSKNVFTGLLLPLLGIFIVGAGWALLNALVQLNPPEGNGPNIAITMLVTLGLALISIMLIQTLIAFLARRFWRFRARSAEEELERDIARLPMLYLRPFALDEETARPSAGELLLGMTPTASAEQVLAKTLSRRKGPVIAIGLPGEKLPGLGAARFYADHDIWHQKVADAANVSQLVIWTTGTTEGLRWEISHLLKSIPPHKLIVWCHPNLLRLDRVEREQEWSEFRATVGKVFPKPLPERLGKTRFIWFRDAWEPVPVSPRWGKLGVLFRIFRDAQAVALKQTLGQKDAASPARPGV